ncbi:type IV pilin N-terminal domain-containing protein [Methanocella arvoryzae]|uniref:Archaeal Type IV pilin N-terminal domain-containing protein n=1 Tax=Methanocella arvoryzae (strain DSM 22066 / NBRC 105507 / MRE50) TaxID=351160 RepID=Q0W7N2_METAR|nr:type IV pilin N-terminal domain-containing protein [Methanocella arvoryzae]CAJ35611.1 hypothetical protein RCIX111 [Methanocella arvoryzae MRE50]
MLRNGKTEGKSDGAASEVIGEMMMLVITVVIFIILIAAVSTIITKPKNEIIHMDAHAVNDTILAIRHTGGDTITYGQIAVVINSQVILATASDTNGNGRWDLGENLYLRNVDTRQRMSIMVYNSMTNHVLGDFTIDTMPEMVR